MFGQKPKKSKLRTALIFIGATVATAAAGIAGLAVYTRLEERRHFVPGAPPMGPESTL